jgi:hypothetical protein
MPGTLGMVSMSRLPTHLPARLSLAAPPVPQGISAKRKKQLLAKLKANAAKVAVASK